MPEAATENQNTSTDNSDANGGETLLNQGENSQNQTQTQNQTGDTSTGDDGGTLLSEGGKGSDGGNGENSTTQSQTANENTNTEITYALNLPENAAINDAVKDSVTAFAKEHKISNEVAQQILNRENAAVVNSEQGRLDDWNKEADGWWQQIKADPEMGGENLGKTDIAVSAILKRFAPPGFIAQLKASRMSENYDFVKMLHNISKAADQDSFHLGGSHGGGNEKKTEQQVADSMFPADKL